MKKLKIILVMLLTTFVTVAQTSEEPVLDTIQSLEGFNPWVINANAGFIKVRDVTHIKPFNVKLGAEYWLNNKFGVGLTAGRTDLSENIRFNQIELAGILNIGRLAKFESFTNMYTILFSLGGSYINSHDNNIVFNDMNGFHISSKITNIIKITDKLSASLGLGLLSGVNSRPNRPNSTITTVIFDFNGGLAYNIGRKEDNPYWQLDEVVSDSIYVDRTVTNILPTKTTINNNNTTVYKYVSVDEYVFFDFDVKKVTKDGYNVILKTADKMLMNPELKVTIVGYACNDGSDAYNLDLSKRRAETIKEYLIKLQISEDRITVLGKGVDRDMLELHNLSRRIKLILN